MLISATQEFSMDRGEVLIYTVSGYNGHTTGHEIQDELGNWNPVPNQDGVIEFTAYNDGEFYQPHDGKYRLVVSGGTGDISYQFAKKSSHRNQ
jgi:hypothetical protein